MHRKKYKVKKNRQVKAQHQTIHDYEEDIETYVMIVRQREIKDENFVKDSVRQDRKQSCK